ncbi:MAG: GlsB/YeaQ/YmgE family stress response membrane protein, partial [Gemmatimonadaceae bacterium]
TPMGLIFAALSGLCVGAIARLFYPGRKDMSLFKTMLLGLGGGFVAGILGRAVGWYSAGQGAGLIASALGAMLLIWIFGKMEARA